MGALDEETEALTPLGAALAALPTDPAAGRALLAGAALGVGEAVAVALAAAEAPRDPLDATAKRALEKTSDALAVVRAAAEKAPCADGRALRDVSREAEAARARGARGRRGGAATARTWGRPTARSSPRRCWPPTRRSCASRRPARGRGSRSSTTPARCAPPSRTRRAASRRSRAVRCSPRTAASCGRRRAPPRRRRAG